MLRKYYKIASAVAILGLSVTPAHAQDVFLQGAQNWATNSLTLRTSQALQNSLSAPDRSPGQSQVVSTASLTYRPSIERRRANLASFVEKTRKNDPEGAAGLERSFAANDVIGLLDRELAPFGLSVSNVADAYTVWAVTAWQAAFDPSASPTRPMAQAVRSQSSNAILASPAFASLSEAEKQEMAEIYIVQAAMIQAAVDQAGGDQARLRQIASAVKKGARASGLDLDRITLTQSGFQPR
ncbi:MAG: DUF6683 family protein [Pseudomonadota bacterium]